LQKIITLLLIVVAVLATYGLHTVIKKNIDPKKSFGHFISYMLLHFAVIFLVVFAVSFIIFRSGNLLFKK